MFDTHTRYSLVLDIVRGRESANQVLADLLEEEGEVALAQWARSGKTSRRRSLEFALQCLPLKVSTQLACDFLEHALAPCRRAEAVYNPTSDFQRDLVERNALAIGEVWDTLFVLREDIASEQMAKSIENKFKTAAVNWAHRFSNQHLGRVPNDLYQAVHHANAAGMFSVAEDLKNSRVHSTKCRDSVRRLARGCRVIAHVQSTVQLLIEASRWLELGNPIHQQENQAKIEELAWQIDRVEHAIEEMLARPNP